MASMIERFPPEILSAICELIADEDSDERNTFATGETSKFKTLKTLSQACRVLLLHCQRYIFRSINIQDHYNHPSTAELFTRLVKGTPGIAEHVRTLRYEMRLDEGLHFSGVAAALDKLTNVRSLTLIIQGYRHYWKDIPRSTRTILLKLIRSPNIVSLELWYIGNLNLSLFLPCPNLQNLYLYGVTYETKKVASKKAKKKARKAKKVNADSLSVRPRRLGVGFSENAPEDEQCSICVLFDEETQDGQPILDLSALKSVSLFISKDYQVALAKAILSKAPQVESIEMTSEDNKLIKSAIEESGSLLSTLKSLTFNVYPVIQDYLTKHPLPWICKALSSIAPKANCLEVINIHVTLSSKTYTEEGDKWRDLERALLASEWASLRHVQLDITSHSIGGKRAMEQLKDLPNTQFPSLSQDQHKFTFGFSVSTPTYF